MHSTCCSSACSLIFIGNNYFFQFYSNSHHTLFRFHTLRFNKANHKQTDQQHKNKNKNKKPQQIMKGMVITVNSRNSELINRFGSGAVSLSSRSERELTRQVSSMQVSGLARAYHVELEARLAEHKVASLSSVASSAMSEVALIHSMEDTLIKGLQGTPVAGVAADRIDVISREFSIAAGQIMLKTAQHLSSM